MLLDKLAFTENKYEELSVKISDPSIMANQKEWRKLCKEHADLEIIVTAYREYKKVLEDLEANKEMLEEESDKEMREMLSEEISSLKEQEEELEKKIQILLLPKDPNDDKNVFVEIRGGAGGDEAALFAANLFRMYTRYAESQRWSVVFLAVSFFIYKTNRFIFIYCQKNHLFFIFLPSSSIFIGWSKFQYIWKMADFSALYRSWHRILLSQSFLYTIIFLNICQ